VLKKIKEHGPWEDDVPEEVATMIKNRALFGYRKPTGAK
jgi:hypothetical protein